MEILTSLNWLDIALALIIVISAVAGLRAGFTQSGDRPGRGAWLA